MRLDHIRDAWLSEGEGSEPDPGAALVALGAARARAAELEANVRRRDWRETVVALVMAPVFLLLAFSATSALATAGALIVVAACLYIPLRLRTARRSIESAGLPVADALRLELEQVEAQQRLLGSTILWYFGPLGLGVALYIAGGTAPLLSRTLQIGALIVLYGLLAVWNIRVARRDLAPTAAALRQAIHEIEAADDAA